jgi:hypothetical protein
MGRAVIPGAEVRRSRTVVVAVIVAYEGMRLIDGAATTLVVMPAGVTYRQAEQLATAHVDELRRQAASLAPEAPAVARAEVDEPPADAAEPGIGRTS